MPSPKPAVIIRREFQATPEVVTQQLRACIIGPACQLVRFANAQEKSKGFIAKYTSRITETFSGNANANDSIAPKDLFADNTNLVIPSIVEGSMLDQDSVKVFVEDALLTYADIVDTDDNGKDFRPNNASAPIANSIAFTSATWTGNNRPAGIPQDVQVGDIVQLYTASGSTSTLTHTSRVAGFTADSVAGGIGTPVLEGAGSSSSGLSRSSIPMQGVTFTLSAAGAYNTAAHFDYDPRISGNTSHDYVLQIIKFTKVAPGQDTIEILVNTPKVKPNVGGIEIQGTFVANNTATFALPNGITITADVSDGGSILVGAQEEFSHTITHTPYTYNSTAGALRLTASGTIASTLTEDTIYYVTCTRGGSVKSAAGATFIVTTNSSNFTPQTFTVANLGTNVAFTRPIGPHGLNLAFGQLSVDTFAVGFVAGDQLAIPVTAASNGAVRTMILADPYVANVAPIVRVRLSKRKTVEVTKFKFDGANNNWSIVNADNPLLMRLNVNKNIIVRDSSVGSGNTNLNVTAGSLYVQYRSILNLPRAVGSVRTLSDITSQIGTIDPENPLAYAVYKAFTNANGATVHYIPILSETLSGVRGFADALDLAKGNRNCYSIVPLTTSSEIWNACVAHIQDESAPDAGRYRILWIAPEVERHYKVQDSPIGSPTTVLSATSSVIDSTTGQYLLSVGAGLDARFTETVRVGDWVRTNFEPDPATGAQLFQEYKVLGIIDNLTLVIGSLNNPQINSEKIEIYRDLTPAEAAQIYVQIAGGFSSERVFAVVPNRGINGLRVDGKPVKNYNVAAAFAGLRSGSRPHQPLSNVELLGFDGTNPTVPAFNEADLDTLRDGGVWVVVNSDTGQVYAERQLSTSTLDNFRKEQSVTCNIDSISFSIGDGLRNLVGRVNISSANLGTVRVNLESILSSFTNAVGSETIGAQLNAYVIDEIFVPSTANDTVKAKVSVTVPLPMNVIDITIVV